MKDELTWLSGFFANGGAFHKRTVLIANDVRSIVQRYSTAPKTINEKTIKSALYAAGFAPTHRARINGDMRNLWTRMSEKLCHSELRALYEQETRAQISIERVAPPHNEEPQTATHKLGGSPADRKIIALEAEVGRLQRELRSSHFDRLNDDAMRALLGNVANTPVQPPKWISTPSKVVTSKSRPEVPVCMLTDWHLGETVDATEVNGCNAYSLVIAECRVQRVTDGIIDLCTKHHARQYPGIVVNLGGDFVSGGLHPELAKTDELESIPAALKARDLIVAVLTRFAGTFGSVYVPCVAGNHGRNTVRPEFKRYVYKNFDWLIYQLLQRHFADDPRVQIDVRASNDVHYRVFGQRYLLVHGDMLGVKGGDGIIGAIGPIMRGEVKKSGQSAALGLEFDKLLMGHWHQQLWLPRAIVANTLKGFDEFARLALGAKPSRPSQPLWFVHPSRGETSHWNVYADDAPATNNEWVSWRAA